MTLAQTTAELFPRRRQLSIAPALQHPFNPFIRLLQPFGQDSRRVRAQLQCRQFLLLQHFLILLVTKSNDAYRRKA